MAEAQEGGGKGKLDRSTKMFSTTAMKIKKFCRGKVKRAVGGRTTVSALREKVPISCSTSVPRQMEKLQHSALPSQTLHFQAEINNCRELGENVSRCHGATVRATDEVTPKST